MKNFTIEFQPVGIRLVCDQAITILDAARQAGINLRADCGGEGICAKCRVRLLSGYEAFQPSEIDRQKLNPQELDQGIRLACTTVAAQNMQVFIPPESMTGEQILQISSQGAAIKADPLIRQETIQVQPAGLSNPQADFERVKAALGNQDISTSFEILRGLPNLLRKNNWQVNLIMRENRILHASKNTLSALVGLAVDVGSTKLACYLVDLQNGKLLAAKGTPNPQVMFGEDIMARLSYAQKGAVEASKLHNQLIDSINRTTEEMCKDIGITPDSIVDACLVGNTAMHHFILNLPSDSLAVSPFVPVISGGLYPDAKAIGVKGISGMGVYAPPVIAGFVGSDHLAFLAACGFGKDKRIRLGIDIGTNTEIALQKGSHIVSVSTASGPAFEGAHIQFGMRAAPGAIEHVRILPDKQIELDIIGQTEPKGICGSGILDAVGEMRAHNILNKRSRLDKHHPLVKLTKDKKAYITLAGGDANTKGVTLSQDDIDQVLLAKGAIRAGIEVLMDYLKVHPDEIDEIVIAGAFGSFMLPELAIRIGMLPEVPLERIHAVGNAAGHGARMLLVSRSARRETEELADRIEYLELTLYPDFDLIYANGISA